MNSSFPNRWSFSYLKFTKYVTNIIDEPKYKHRQQEQQGTTTEAPPWNGQYQNTGGLKPVLQAPNLALSFYHGSKHKVVRSAWRFSNVLVPAEKAANNVVVVWRLHYINTLKQELSGTKAYKETSEEEKSVVNGHCNHLALKFSVCVKERQDRLPTMYWLPKLHKKTYKARFIANSSFCSTTELSKLLISCLTAVKNSYHKILWKSLWKVR